MNGWPFYKLRVDGLLHRRLWQKGGPRVIHLTGPLVGSAPACTPAHFEGGSMSILIRAAAAYLVLVAVAVAVLFIITPLYHPGGGRAVPGVGGPQLVHGGRDGAHPGRRLRRKAACRWRWSGGPEALPGSETRFFYAAVAVFHHVLLELVQLSVSQQPARRTTLDRHRHPDAHHNGRHRLSDVAQTLPYSPRLFLLELESSLDASRVRETTARAKWHGYDITAIQRGKRESAPPSDWTTAAGLRVVNARFVGKRQFDWDLFAGYDRLRVLTYSASSIALKSLLVLSPEPPVVGALGDSKLTEHPTFWETGGSHLGQRLRLLRGTHPLVPVASRAIGMAVFLRRYPSRDRSPTNCLSSPFSPFSCCTSW